MDRSNLVYLRMTLCNDAKELIRFGDNYAEIEMPFRGSTTDGMLLWLDEHMIKQWWKLSDVKIEPGGMFYLRWSDKEDDNSHAVYGILSEIDTEACFFRVKKVIYVNGETKLHNLKLHVSFVKYSENDSIIKVRLSHSFDRRTKVLFDKSVLMSWPGTLGLFRKFIEN